MHIKREISDPCGIVEKKKKLAETPPLGWNSYDSYGIQINENEAIANLEIFAAKLAPHGYKYFVIDYGWYNECVLIPDTCRTWKDHFDHAIDGNGYPVSSRTFFPSGIRRIADRAHQLGVKFGLHLMRGVLRKAWDFNLPVKNTNVRIRDIADVDNICSWADYTYGIDMSKPGAQEYYNGLVNHMADLGVDLIKYDDLVPHPAEMEAIGKAVAQCERDIVLSLSPGDDTTVENKPHYLWGHMLRITKDVWDKRSSIDDAFTRWEEWQGKSEPGFWPDMDMLCLGTLCGRMNALPDKPVSMPDLTPEALSKDCVERTFFRSCHFTKEQERTFLTIRALSASPLFMGGCLIRTDQDVIGSITNRKFLSCNQNGISGTLQYRNDGIDIWQTPSASNATKGWIGIFNRNSSHSISRKFTNKDLGLSQERLTFYDIWGEKKVDLSQITTIAPEDVLFLEFSKTE